MKRVAALLALALLGGCGEAVPPASGSLPPEAAVEPAVVPAPAAESAGLPQENAAQWARSCALCHVRGEGGAPTVGDVAAWSTRRQQGEEALLMHVIEGYNNMPPLGYCMDCSREDFRRLIRFMAGES